MRQLRRGTRRFRGPVGLVVDELRDAWAIAAAELTGLVTYMFGGPLWVAALSAGSVLGVRVAAGLWLPREQAQPREPLLSEDELTVANLTVDGYTVSAIARALGRGVGDVRELQRAVHLAAGSRDPNRLREWLRANGLRPRTSIVRVLINSDLVRATETIGSLYTVYRTIVCPLLHSIWPELQCP